MALILVLAFLVLISGLIVAFLASMSGEQASTRSYASEMQARQLAETAVQLVIAQVSLGTASSGTSAVTGQACKIGWASQPGMIRTYDDSGNPSYVYKLYSSGTMVQASANFTPSEDLPAYSAWGVGGTEPGLYTDINQPALISDTAGLIVPDPTTGKTYDAEYPIVDPAAMGGPSVSGSVEGFAIFSGTSGSGGPVSNYGGSFPMTSGTYNPLANPNPAPMPVAWLYVLQNGQIIAPSGVTNGIVTFPSSASISSTNPIVGRVAFWTDDETCKLNINTASEGAGFDVPRATVQNEVNMVQSTPVIDEFQRTPGHPAMTCLSPALGWINGLQRADTTGTFNSGNYPVARAYYDIAPRVNYICASGLDQTSQGGSVNEGTVVANTNTNGVITVQVVPDGDRLYASLDELVFHSGTTSTSGTVSRLPNPQVQIQTTGQVIPVINEQDIEETRFFLTSSSRAPETTMFNTPRISLWPLEADGNVTYSNGSPYYSNEDAKDALLKFCTSLGGVASTGTAYPYYFQRYSEAQNFSSANTLAWSGSPLTSIPSCYSSSVDYTQIPRNQQIYSYLQNLTSQNIPGYGGSFGASTGSKWSPLGRDQVLTEMFDFIRSGLDQSASGLQGQYWYPCTGGAGQRFVAPMNIVTTSGTTHGFGRFQTIVEAAIVFFATGAQPAVSGTTVEQPGSAPYVPMSTTQMQAVLILMPFNPMPGMWNWYPLCRYDISFQNGGFNLAVNGGTSSSFQNAVTRVSAAMGGSSESGSILPLPGLWQAFQVDSTLSTSGSVGTKTVTNVSPDQDQSYPFCTAPVTVPVPTGTNAMSTFNFTGGTMTIKIRSGAGTAAVSSGTSDETYQTINMTFPNYTNVVVPQVITTTGSTYAQLNWTQRMTNCGTGNLEGVSPGIIQDGDIVRAVEVDPNGPTKGDFRLVAAASNVDPSYFHPYYDAGTSISSTSTVTPYTSTQLDYNTSVTTANTSGSNLNKIAAARLGRFQDSLRATKYNVYQYGIGNGAKNENGATFSTVNINNYSDQPWTGDKINPEPTNASTLQGSGTSTIGLPNPGGLVAGIKYANIDTPVAAHGMTAALNSSNLPGDWDSGAGECPDGPYINKPDPGNLNFGADADGYWSGTTSNSDNGASYSPNRMVASPIFFGSLPTPNNTGVLQPWQTLLFCPNPPAGSSHPGFGTVGSIPPDTMMLDLFTMPTVEPYAISEPLSTAGKVNLNYQIVPFTYIRRDTAVRGVLKSVQMGAIPNNITNNNAFASDNQQTCYKYTDPVSSDSGNVNQTAQTRFTLNLDEVNGTLAGFESRFNNGDIFRSAGDICSVFLVPNDASDPNFQAASGPNYTSMTTGSNGWWGYYELTGENMRESPYNQIYPRITTKSNSFTIHYKVEVLKKSPPSSSTPVNGWNESLESVVSTYRGSTEIERYVDPSDPTLPDFVKNDSNGATISGTNCVLDSYYKYREVSTRRFNP